jgi:hypothetical protein
MLRSLRNNPRNSKHFLFRVAINPIGSISGSYRFAHISRQPVDIRGAAVNIDCNHEPHEPEGMGLALAPRCTRLRAGFVVRTKTESKRAAGVKPAALSFLE